MRSSQMFLLLLPLVAPLAGCEGSVETRDAPASRAAEALSIEPGIEPGIEPAIEPAAQFRVVMLGDSLTAGQGLMKREAFPSLIEAELRRRGWSIEVVNGGVSGDTTAGGRARLGWLLVRRPHVVVVGLGANDGLRGVPVAEVERNLRSIVEASLDAGAFVLLAGMQIPPNYGADYAGSFSAVYPALAAEFDISFMPFLLEGVGGQADLNQADGIHPNAAGHKIIATALVPYLEDLLVRARGEEAA